MHHLVLAWPLLLAVAVAAQDPAPVVPPAAGQAPAAKVDFVNQVAPILVQRCIECHGPKEQKGDLRLDARSHAFPEGDEAAWSVVAGKPDDSELIRRIGLPVADDEVMPNKGEPLTKPQQDLLRQWVAEGAVWPAAGDEAIAKALAAMVVPKITFELPEVSAEQQAAIDQAMAALRAKGAVVQLVAADTRAVDVNLSLLRDQVGDAELALLEPLAPVLVWLNLSRTKISDAGLRSLLRLGQLRRLHVAGTGLGDGPFKALTALRELEYLNAVGCNLDDAGLQALAELPKLQKVYAWQSKVTKAGKLGVNERRPALQVDLGDYVEERLAAAQQEIAAREARNQPVNTTCPVADKPIDPAITVLHDGKRIAFCCGKCKAAFEKDPAKYLAKLPGAEPAKDAPAKVEPAPASKSGN